jgi:Leucine Rich repeat
MTKSRANERLHDKTSLGLSSKGIDSEQATEIAHELATNSTLTWLSLDENNVGADGASAIANALTKNRTLMSIGLCKNSIGDAGAVAIAMALLQNKSLKKLFLYDNSIGRAGATAFAETLRTNSCLKFLCLGENRIGENGTEALAGALAANQSLAELSLANCRIGNVGATALAQALKSNTTLTTLYFGGNTFDMSGLTAIAYDLTENKGLTTLHLDVSSISDDGAATVAEMLRKNSSLKHLFLSRNNVGDAGAMSILNSLAECNTTLTSVDLTHNTNISNSSRFIIEDILKANMKGTRSVVHPIVRPAPTTLTPPPSSVPPHAMYDEEIETEDAPAPEAAMPQVTTNEADIRSVPIVRSALENANPPTASVQPRAPRETEPEFEVTPAPIAEMPQATTNEDDSLSVIHPINANPPPHVSLETQPETEAMAAPEVEMPQATNETDTRSVVRPATNNANPSTVSTQLQATLEIEQETEVTQAPQAEMPPAATTPPIHLVNFHSTQDPANSEDEDNETGWMEGLPKQRAELEYAIRLLEPIRDSAEQKISLMQRAIASGNYPTGDELEQRVTDLTAEIQHTAQIEAFVATASLQRLLQLQSDLTRERDAEVRMREVMTNRAGITAMVDAHREPTPAPGASATSVANHCGTQDPASGEDSNMEWMGSLSNQPGELGFTIRRVTMVHDAAKKILRRFQTAAATGNYPTGEELEGILAGVTIE